MTYTSLLEPRMKRLKLYQDTNLWHLMLGFFYLAAGNECSGACEMIMSPWAFRSQIQSQAVVDSTVWPERELKQVLILETQPKAAVGHLRFMGCFLKKTCFNIFHGCIWCYTTDAIKTEDKHNTFFFTITTIQKFGVSNFFYHFYSDKMPKIYLKKMFDQNLSK